MLTDICQCNSTDSEVESLYISVIKKDARIQDGKFRQGNRLLGLVFDRAAVRLCLANLDRFSS